jgi:hypothetical protein
MVSGIPSPTSGLARRDKSGESHPHNSEKRRKKKTSKKKHDKPPLARERGLKA